MTRKRELLERQKAQRASDPFGGFAALVRGPAMPRIFASPGPIYEPEGSTRDYWRVGRALYAAGFRSGDLVHNAFSYHMTPGAFIMESRRACASAARCSRPASGQTEQQLQAIAELRPRGLRRHARASCASWSRRRRRAAADISSLRKGMVGGEALPPSLRDWFAGARHGRATRATPRPTWA